MAVPYNEGNVGQLTASEGHLEVLCQLVAVGVLLMNTVEHRGWWAGEREERGREAGRWSEREKR